MDPVSVVRFDSALARAESFVAAELREWIASVVLIRDIYGRIRVAVDDRPRELPKDRILQAVRKMHDVLGAFSPGASALVLFGSEMVAPDEIFAAAEIRRPGPAGIRTLDRQVTGADWNRAPFVEQQANRLTLYGVKGGVGRSTAAAVLCWRLAQAGKKVLVVDLDLESPGLGTTLLPEERQPDFGIVDWFVEDAVGQAGSGFLSEMLASSPLAQGRADLLVVPAGGRAREGYSYLPKLSRTYAEVFQNERATDFADRLHRLIEELERLAKPDATIIDSRAGLHDIAAVAVTRLNAISLLFAFDNSQNWHAYQTLFEGWGADASRVSRFRENLKMVAALVPETETLPYLEALRENAYRLFERFLYEEAGPSDEDRFNFDVKDPEAPHAPLRVNWSRSIQQFDPVRRPEAVTEEQITAAFGDFVRETTRMLFGEPAK